MNQIPLELIHPSPNPIRKSWDEGKMEELAQSIAERGVIVPIKVRPNGSGYEVVYGHRRVEAARRAGLSEMPVIVDSIDDIEVLVQAFIENVQREDMSSEDTAITLDKIKDLTGWSNYELEKRGVFDEDRARELGYWLEEKRAGLAVTLHAHQGEGVRQTLEIRRSLGNDQEGKRAVSRKASDEGLTYPQTRAVAEAYKAASSPELRQSVLDTPGKFGDGDAKSILTAARMKLGSQAITGRAEQERRKAYEDYDQGVKDFIDSVKLFDRMVATAAKAAHYGKFSPEGARFVSRRIDATIAALQELQEELDDVN